MQDVDRHDSIHLLDVGVLQNVAVPDVKSTLTRIADACEKWDDAVQEFGGDALETQLFELMTHVSPVGADVDEMFATPVVVAQAVTTGAIKHYLGGGS